MIIDGEKWACEACVRGHRVSNCQHSDRPLQHINKKGRPVSQCQHCRAMRKSRSAHIKCDCGEKTSKCIHLRAPQEGHRETCCCNHGGRCTCVHKEQGGQLDPVPECRFDKDSASAKTARQSPTGVRVARKRANTIHADGVITFDENGRRKPMHKSSKASLKCGPYQLSRVHSLHNSGGMARSADNLLQKNFGNSKKRVSAAAESSMSQSRSETASPQMPNSPSSSSFSPMHPALHPLDLSSLDYPSFMPPFDPFCANLGEETRPMFNDALRNTTPIDWTGYDGLTSFGASSYGQDSNGGFGSAAAFEFGSDQGLTNTTASEDTSEVEDFAPAGHRDDGFRLSTPGSFIGLNQGQMITSPDVMTFDEVLKQPINKFMSSTSVDEPSYTLPHMSLAEEAFWTSEIEGAGDNISDSPIESGAAYWDRQ